MDPLISSTVLEISCSVMPLASSMTLFCSDTFSRSFAMSVKPATPCFLAVRSSDRFSALSCSTSSSSVYASTNTSASMSPSSFFIFLYAGSAAFIDSYFARHSSSDTTATEPSDAVSFSYCEVSVAFFSCSRSSFALRSDFLRDAIVAICCACRSCMNFLSPARCLSLCARRSCTSWIWVCSALAWCCSRCRSTSVLTAPLSASCSACTRFCRFSSSLG
mmetsp:Transcript_21136/g.63247  ORF Transcript_21136/g.63247 Transcript_21136/m.63247 type:complete len:219 (-) Transcript_21136:1261-1917(-)